MRSDAIKPGDIIAGKYRVRAILSRSRGFLVEAFHTEFDQRAVIRVLSPNLVDDKEVERFRREARTLAKLESEHVARILDVGTTPDGAFYFARQYLDGQDLAAHLKQRGPLPFAEAVLYVLQAAEAVAETHVHNIILRELQPAHLFLTQRLGSQQIKVIDFGTAKLMREAAAPTAGGELTATAMFGLSCYSSPELVRKAKHVDVRTDVWSLGAILYQLLAGRPPFGGELAALMLAITRDEPVPLTRLRRDLPGEIDSIIGWALAKDPDGRFANVHGFAHALLPFTGPEGQLLVKRIGEITTAGKQKQRHQAAAMDRDHPVTMDGSEVLDDDDDDPRTAYRAPSEPVVSPGYRANIEPEATSHAQEHPSTPPLDRTVFIQGDYPNASPASPHAAKQPVPEPRASRPAWQPMPGPMTPGAQTSGAATPSAAPSSPGSQQPASVHLQAPPTLAAAQAAQPTPPPPARPPMGSVPSFAASGYSAPDTRPAPRGQKIALGAVASAVVLLSVVAVLVVVKSKDQPPAGPEATTATTSAAAATAAPATAQPTVAPPPPTPTATAEPAATEAPAAPATAAPAPPTATATVRVAVATASNPVAPTTPVTKASAKPKADPPTPPTPPPPSTGSGDNGTLVAVAVGGTCAFSVNGASKGTSSSLKLSIKPGTYSVTCAPSSGSSKSKSVTVTSGGTAMAMFKL
jgi:serine/threonine-protein kinase